MNEINDSYKQCQVSGKYTVAAGGGGGGVVFYKHTFSVLFIYFFIYLYIVLFCFDR